MDSVTTFLARWQVGLQQRVASESAEIYQKVLRAVVHHMSSRYGTPTFVDIIFPKSKVISSVPHIDDLCGRKTSLR